MESTWAKGSPGLVWPSGSSKTSSFWLSYTWQPLLVSTQQILTKHTLCLGTSKDFSYHPVTIFWGH